MYTLTAKWDVYEIYKGVVIYKRKPQSGTATGLWKTAATVVKTLRAARKVVDDMRDADRAAFYYETLYAQ